MSTYLLTWNPNRWHWENLPEMVDAVAKEGSALIRWSCGNTKKIEAADRAFLLRQGVEPRGIIASGTVVAPPYEAPHWDPDISGPALYVDVKLDALLDPEAQDILWREVLDEPHLSGMHWDTQSSGTTIPEAVADALEREWDALIRRNRTSSRTTTGTRTRNSDSHPIEVDFLDEDTSGLPGRLGMTILPGVKAPGRWDRNLGADLRRLRSHHGADVLVNLLERKEFDAYGVPDLLECSREVGLEVIHFPIKDVSTPRKAQTDEYAGLIWRVVGLLREGKIVVVHCRGGLGRTGTVAASVIVALGQEDPDSAIALVRTVRSDRAVETPEQEEYVRSFARSLRAENRSPNRRTPGPEPTQIERYRGCFLGLAVGDALGTTVEFESPGTFRPVEDMVGGGPFDLRAGEWTDDTSMALCLAESLIETQGFDPADQLRKYVRWYREGRMSATGEFFDIGNATREALERFEKTGEPYAGSRDPRRAGNGSIMRLAPVALFYARGPLGYAEGERTSEAIERCAESSRTTHGAETCLDACRYLGGLIVGAVNGAGKEELLSEHYCPVSGYFGNMPLSEAVDSVAAGTFKDKGPPEIRGTGYVVDSLEAALWAFYNSDSFEEGALLAVNLGDDADTTGAVYGQLAGAYYGERGIPASWRRKLAHRLLIERFAEQLHAFGRNLDWGRLVAYLPTFERPGYEFARGSSWSAEALDFQQALHDTALIFDFDWGAWHDEAERFFDDPEAVAGADEATLRRLLTLHARREHFDEDHLLDMLRSGHVSAILRRARKLTVG